MRVRACVSPVNIGFAENGFQAAVKLEEGHVLGREQSIRTARRLWGGALPSPVPQHGGLFLQRPPEEAGQ